MCHFGFNSINGSAAFYINKNFKDFEEKMHTCQKTDNFVNLI